MSPDSISALTQQCLRATSTASTPIPLSNFIATLVSVPSGHLSFAPCPALHLQTVLCSPSAPDPSARVPGGWSARGAGIRAGVKAVSPVTDTITDGCGSRHQAAAHRRRTRDATARTRDATGRSRDAHCDIPGTSLDGPGTPLDGPGTPLDGPGTPLDGPGTPLDGPGMALGRSPGPLDAHLPLGKDRRVCSKICTLKAECLNRHEEFVNSERKHNLDRSDARRNRSAGQRHW